jgi:hypothetical protein
MWQSLICAAGAAMQSQRQCKAPKTLIYQDNYITIKVKFQVQKMAVCQFLAFARGLVEPRRFFQLFLYRRL